jgi:hypothetical protein
MAVIMKSAVSWDLMPCSLIEVYQFPRRLCCLCHDYQTALHQISEVTSLHFTIYFIEQLKALLFLSTSSVLSISGPHTLFLEFVTER